MGLPIKSFIAATNANDTVPRYLQTGQWKLHTTSKTLSNAMDVSNPNNWPRIEEIYKNLGKRPCEELQGISVNEKKTMAAMRELSELGYIADPHSAIAYAGLKTCLKENEQGIFLCTAHPAKFKLSIEKIIKSEIQLPLTLEKILQKPILSEVIAADESLVQNYLKRLQF
jgi:threonine synthase